MRPHPGQLTELAIFDIDGPVTDPASRKIEYPEILDLRLDFLVGSGFLGMYGRGTVTYLQALS